MRYFKLDRAYLVTAQRDEMIEVDEGTIEVVPMWKWLLQ
jgi:predicted AAA+ superfamily ATPase